MSSAVYRHKLPAAILVAFLVIQLAVPQWAFAKRDFTVVSGSVTVDNPDANTERFNIDSDQAILSFPQLDIAPTETLDFHFTNPTDVSSILNRITDGIMSNIAGTILSNGMVFLVNPAGFNITETARIEVARGLVVATLTITDENFLKGNYVFEQDPNYRPSLVRNAGVIFVTKPGGLVALLGGAVQNSGLIVAELGSVVLAAGSKATLSFDQSGWLAVAVDKLTDIAIGLDGKPVSSAIEQSGTISAVGGHVLVHASALAGLFDLLVNLPSGLIEAVSAVSRNGRVELVGEGGKISNFSRIRVDGTSDNANGGQVFIKGTRIVQGGTISANAAEGGQAGEIGVTSEETTLLSGSRLEAKASGANGRGGTVRVVSAQPKVSGNLNFQSGALIDVSGGTLAGDAGFIELSAATIQFSGQAIGQAAEGSQGGRLFVDPLNLIFNTTTQTAPTNNSTGTADIAFNSPDTTSTTTVEIADIVGFAEAFFQAVQDITVNSALTMSSNNDLRFEAGRDIKLNANVRVQGNNGDMTMIADKGFTGFASDGVGTIVQAVGTNLQAANGNIVLQTGQDFTVRDIITTSSGTVSVTSTAGNILDDGSSSTLITTGTLTLTANAAGKGVGTTGALNTDITTLNLNVGSGGASLKDAASYTLGSAAVAANGSLDLQADTDLTVDNNVAVAVTGTGTLNLVADANNNNSGGLTMNTGSSLSSASGNITLSSGTGDIFLKTVTSTSGNISASSRADVHLDNNMVVSTTGAGTIQLTADSESNGSGTFVQDTGSSVTTAGGNITISGSDNMTIRTISAGAGDVSITAVGNTDVSDDGSNTTKITANKLTINAGGQIGATTSNDELDTSVSELDVTASAGSIILSNDKALIVTNASAAGVNNDVTITTTAGDLTVGSVTAADDVTLTASAGNINDNADDATVDITGDLITLIANAAGKGIGTANGTLDVNANNLALTVGSGGANLHEIDNVTLNAPTIAAGGGLAVLADGTLTLPATAITLSGSGAMDLRSNGGNLSTAAALTTGTGSLTLSASGTLTAGHNLTTSGGAINLTADNNGSGGESFLQNSGVTIASGGGDIGITVGNGATGIGNINLRTVNAGAGNITATNAQGSILEAAAGASSLTGNTVSLSAGSVTPGATSVGTAANILKTTATTLAGTSGSGGVFVTESNGANLAGITSTGAVTISSTTGSLNDDGNNATVVAGTTLTLTANAAGAGIGTGANGAVDTDATTLVLNAGSGGVQIEDAGSVTLNTPTVAAGGNVTVAAKDTLTLGGAVAATGNGSISLIGDFDGNGTGTLTQAGNAITTAGGNIDLTVGNGATGGQSLTLDGTVNAGSGDVTVTVRNGDILQSGAPTLTGNQVTLTAGGSDGDVGTSVDKILTTAGKLIATATGTGDIFLTESNGATLSATTAGGSVDATTTTGNWSVNTISAGAGAVSLTATAGSINDDIADAVTDITANSLTLTASAAGQGVGTANGTLDTVVGSLASTVGSGGLLLSNTGNFTVSNVVSSGDVTLSGTSNLSLGVLNAGTNTVALTAANAITDTNGAVLNITGGTVNLTANNGGIDTEVNASTSVSANSSVANGAVDLTSTAGNLLIDSINAGAGSVTLTSAAAIEESGADAAADVTASTVNLTAATGIGSLGALETAVASTITGTTVAGDINLTHEAAAPTTLTLTTGNGSVAFSQTGGQNLLVNNVAASNGSVTLSNTADLLLGTVTAGTGVSLTAAGSILDNNGGTLNITAGTDSTLTAGGVIGTVADPLDVSVIGGSLAVSAASQLSGVSVDINGVVSPGNALNVPLPTPLGSVIFNGTTVFPTLSTATINDILSQSLSFISQQEQRRHRSIAG